MMEQCLHALIRLHCVMLNCFSTEKHYVYICVLFLISCRLLSIWLHSNELLATQTQLTTQTVDIFRLIYLATHLSCNKSSVQPNCLPSCVLYLDVSQLIPAAVVAYGSRTRLDFASQCWRFESTWSSTLNVSAFHRTYKEKLNPCYSVIIFKEDRNMLRIFEKKRILRRIYGQIKKNDIGRSRYSHGKVKR
jgi:hypothetical protein